MALVIDWSDLGTRPISEPSLSAGNFLSSGGQDKSHATTPFDPPAPTHFSHGPSSHDTFPYCADEGFRGDRDSPFAVTKESTTPPTNLPAQITQGGLPMTGRGAAAGKIPGRLLLNSAPPALKKWLLIFGVFTALTLLFADTHYWIERGFGRPNLMKAIWWHAMSWYAWFALLPAIMWNCRRLEGRTHRAPQIGQHLLAGACFALVHNCVLTTGAWIEAELLMTGRSWWNLWSHFIFIQNFHLELFSYAAIVCVWYMVDYSGKFAERTQKAAELERQLSTAQLQALKMQLHPHFFFNTLNGIAALNYEDPRTANRMIAKLSELLRITLADTGQPETLLRQELDFNQRYLELEQLRLGDRLSVTIDVSAETLEARVPTLLLQPLIENCIRHGIAPFAARGSISIHAHRDGAQLHLRVSDNGPGVAPSQSEATKEGIGLSNTRRRLQQLYGDCSRFDLSGNGSGWTVAITIPFRLSDTRETSQATLA